MPISLAGKTAIVTGAATGFGLVIGRHFLDCGANVMFADADEDRLEAELGSAVRKEGAARMFAGDLREKLSIANLLSATMDAFDRVDILVNTAAPATPADALSLDRGVLGEMLEQNLLSALRLSQMTAKRMIAASPADADPARTGEGAPQHGAIVNLTSIAATRLRPEYLCYSIACAALDQMTRALAVSLAPKGIRVNAVAAGSVMNSGLQAVMKGNPGLRGAVIARTPLGRIAPAGDLVQTVAFLASEASAFMTGQIVTVDGGRSLLDAVQTPAP